MRLVVVYESMFGATRIIAQAIAGGSTEYDETTVVRANEVGGSVLYDADLVVVGGPTHVRSMSRPSTRKGAPGYAKKHGGGLELEPGADDAPGVREWIDHLGQHTNFAAAFDTRVKGPAALTGSACKAIDADGGEDDRTNGFRRILATEPVHPYIPAWWPPGHGLGYDHTFTNEVADFVKAVVEGTDPEPSFADGLQVQRVLAAVEQSAANNSGWTVVGAG